MVRVLQVNILRSMVNVFTIQRKVCVKEISNLVEVQNKIKIKCFNIVSVVTDNVDDNGENKGVIEKELTKIKKLDLGRNLIENEGNLREMGIEWIQITRRDYDVRRIYNEVEQIAQLAVKEDRKRRQKKNTVL